MADMQWDSELSVGIDLIDEQHQSLIRHLNEVHNAVLSMHSGQIVLRSLAFLIQYAHRHLELEEEAMARCNYPEQAEHIEQHNEFRGYLAHLEQEFVAKGPSPKLGIFIDNMLINWFHDHILNTDRMFGNYLMDHDVDLSD